VSLLFAFPPVELHAWRSLNHEGRELWLRAMRDRVFEGAERFPFSKASGRRVELDGALFDDLTGFYCAIGEAVNGPGGYFGASPEAFHDCLFGGFGLEVPYTVVWRDSGRSARALDSAALLSYLDSECDGELDSVDFAEGIAWRDRTRAAAMSGKRTMFDEIVETIRSVTSPNGGSVTLLLE
jgi:hypothetical protein